jgi:rhamnosyltransferase
MAAISVVIRTFNSAATLLQVLSKLEPGPEDEILIVDSGSSDATLEHAKDFPARIFNAGKPFHYSQALNVGFREARNPWVLVISSHSIPIEPGYLAAWRRTLERLPGQVVVAYGLCLLTPTDNVGEYRKTFACLDKKAWEKTKTPFGGNTNAIYRRDCWQRHEFCESIPTAEDLEWLLWALDHGYMIANVPERIVIYRNLGSLRHMYGKGFQEAKIARTMLRTTKIPIKHLLIAVASLVKKLVLGQMEMNLFMKQCAHRIGAFLGSRCPRKP